MSGGMGTKPSAAEAASLVKAERARAAARTKPTTPEPPKHETVQSPEIGWVGAESGDVDENELERRQRAISQRLIARQRQLAKDGAELERVRKELAALEAPLKAEIMSLRSALEDSNKREKFLVDEINALRDTLHEKEKEVVDVRSEKQQHADSLISVMADYEKRKTDALNGIASLVGEDPIESSSMSPIAAQKEPASSFLGF